MDNTVVMVVGGLILAVGPLSIAGVLMKIGSYKTKVDEFVEKLISLEKRMSLFVSKEQFNKDMETHKELFGEFKKEIRFARQEDMKTIKSLEQKIDDFSAKVLEKLETISNQTSAASAKEELILKRIEAVEKKVG